MKRRTFEEWFEDFIRYNENGSVPFKYISSEGYALGQWVNNIRAGRYKLTEEQKKGIVHQMEERAKTYGIPSYAERMMGKIKELAEPSGKTKTTGTTIPTAYTR